MQKEHLHEFDVIRVFAAFTVIAIHITASYVYYTKAAYILNQLARFAVPLFLVMSGFLLYYADLNKGFSSVKIFYEKRFKRLLKPYIVWTLIYTGFNAYVACDWSNELIKIPYHIIWGTASYHLYFIIIILQLYLIYPWLRRKIKEQPVATLLASLFLSFICQTLLYFDMLGVYKLPAGYNMFYLVFFPVWIFYFVFGMIAALNREKWEEYLRTRKTMAVLLWAASLFLLLGDSFYTGSFAASLRPTVMLYTVSTYFLFYVFFLPYRDLIGKISVIGWLSRQSFFIFLAHPLVIAALIYLSLYMNISFIWEGNKGMFLQYIITLLITLVLAYGASLTPAAGYLGGEEKSR